MSGATSATSPGRQPERKRDWFRPETERNQRKINRLDDIISLTNPHQGCNMVYNVEGVDDSTKRFFNQLVDALFDVWPPDELEDMSRVFTREEVIVEINKLCRQWTVTARIEQHPW